MGKIKAHRVILFLLFFPRMTQSTLPSPQPQAPTRFSWDWLWLALWVFSFLLSYFGSIQGVNSLTSFNISLMGLAMAGCQITLTIFKRRAKVNESQKADVIMILLGIQVVLWVVLVFISPLWMIHIASVFIQVHLNLTRGIALSLDVLLFLGALLQQIQYFGFTLFNMAAFVVLTLLAYVFGQWIYNILSDSEEKQRLIDQLRAAQDELAAAERREGVLAERSRLARDIHDTLAQGYIGVIMHLEAADSIKDDQPEKADFHLKQAEEVARVGLRQARQVVNDLRPDLLETSQNTADALRTVVESWSESNSVEAEFIESGTPASVHPETELTLLRTTQEGLANILKHAEAEHVQVTLSWIGDQVVLDIEDDGIGFGTNNNEDEPNHFTGGFGLKSMNERVTQSAGELFIETDPAEGTTLTVILPIVMDNDAALHLQE
ncbi:MAG: sensor histidine kinase [Chloroflexota bacterium]